jgi:hypothetical protein
MRQKKTKKRINDMDKREKRVYDETKCSQCERGYRAEHAVCSGKKVMADVKGLVRDLKQVALDDLSKDDKRDMIFEIVGAIEDRILTFERNTDHFGEPHLKLNPPEFASEGMKEYYREEADKAESQFLTGGE